MKATTAAEEQDLARELLGSEGSFAAYFQHYNDLVTKDDPFDAQAFSILRTHEDVLFITRYLMSNPRVTKRQAIAYLQGKWHTYENIGNILSLAVQAMAMVDSDAQRRHPAHYVLGGYQPKAWGSQEPLFSFIERSLPKSPSSTRNRLQDSITDIYELRAWKLQKYIGMAFRSTDNISEHLLLDTKENVLYLFHHVGYMKAHLAKCKYASLDLETTTEDGLKQGTLPPQLLAETLHSLQGILFQSLDRKSRDILDALIHKEGFDPRCSQYQGYEIFSEPPEGFEYVYWGKRLTQLYEFVKSRPPRNKFEKWFQQKTSERNALLIALLALFISIFVGILSIILGCVQVWIAWMAWKHPVQGNG